MVRVHPAVFGWRWSSHTSCKQTTSAFNFVEPRNDLVPTVQPPRPDKRIDVELHYPQRALTHARTRPLRARSVECRSTDLEPLPTARFCRANAGRRPRTRTAYLLSLVRRRYAPEAVAHVGKFLLDRLGHRRMAGDTHVAHQVLVRPRSPRSYHRVLAARAAHAGRRVTPFRDHRRVVTSCADIALRLPRTPRVDTPLTMRASAAPAISFRMVWSPCSAARPFRSGWRTVPQRIDELLTVKRETHRMPVVARRCNDCD